MKKFIEIDIPLKGFQTDVLSGILYSEGCLGIYEINPKEWRIYFNRNWTSDWVANLFLKFEKLNPDFEKKSVVVSEVPLQDWNLEWKKYFIPIQPVKNIWIRPPWEKLPSQARGIDIIIDPQMAFGTGHHETTTLMIKLMDQMSIKELDILDVGTGSGILAILAGKLGANSVTAIDIDSDAIANANHNIELNQIESINTRRCDVQMLQDSKFSLILANINYEILSSGISKLKSLIKENGKLLISGILKEEAADLISLYEKRGLKLKYKEDLKEWTAMVWEKG